MTRPIAARASPACRSSAVSTELDEAVRRTGARMLLITMPNASGETVRKIMDRAVEAGLTVRTVPPDLRIARRQPQRESAARGPPGGPAHPRAGDRPRPGRRRHDPRPGRDDHRGRRLDRIGARPTGLRLRTEPPRPRRSSREPALHDPARARAARPRRSRPRRSLDPPRQRREPCRRQPPHRGDQAGGHLPRRRLQARADDGGASLGGGPGQHRRHHGRPVRGRRRGRAHASSSYRPTRPSSHRA